MQFADGPLAFASGADRLRKQYSPKDDGDPGDSYRLAYLETLAAAPHMAHFKRPERSVASRL